MGGVFFVLVKVGVPGKSVQGATVSHKLSMPLPLDGTTASLRGTSHWLEGTSRNEPLCLGGMLRAESSADRDGVTNQVEARARGARQGRADTYGPQQGGWPGWAKEEEA